MQEAERRRLAKLKKKSVVQPVIVNEQEGESEEDPEEVKNSDSDHEEEDLEKAHSGASDEEEDEAEEEVNSAASPTKSPQGEEEEEEEIVASPQPFTNQPRKHELRPCGQCEQNVQSGNFCDICGSWMHDFCGIRIGEKGDVRRCTFHAPSEKPTMGGESKGHGTPSIDPIFSSANPKKRTTRSTGPSAAAVAKRCSPRTNIGTPDPANSAKTVGGTVSSTRKRKQPPPAAALRLPPVVGQKKVPPSGKKLDMAKVVEEFDDYMDDTK
jgi:hypothetical protein